MAQSILKKDLCSLRDEYDKKLVSHADESILKRKFDLGNPCREKAKFDMKILEILRKDCIYSDFVGENIFDDHYYIKKICVEALQPKNSFSSDFSSDFS